MDQDQYQRLVALKQAYGGEALFRPSSISRIISCPGSVALSARAGKGHESKYALEGSVAHYVAEQALKGIRQPDEWTDRMVALDDKGMRGGFVDAEMTENVQGYVDEVLSDIGSGIELLTEHRMSLAPLAKIVPVEFAEILFAENRGTADAVLIDRARRKAILKDLKYGRGVMVDADSPQLKNYAVLIILNFPGIDEVEMVIVQPRALQESQRLKKVVYKTSDLMTDFLGTLLEAMHTALGPEPVLKTGDHCRWCRAKEAGLCPLLQDEALHIGEDQFAKTRVMTIASQMGPIPDQVHLATLDAPAPAQPMQNQIVLPMASSLDAADIASILERRHLWDTWIESVENRAARLIEAGITVPGWQLSRRSGHRKWKEDEKTTREKLLALGLKATDIYPPAKLVSPAQAEKKLPKDKRDSIETMIERPLGEPQLIRATEARAEIAFKMGPIG